MNEAAFRLPTSEFEKKVKEGYLNFLSVKSIVAIAGGVPLIKDNIHYGSIGISGAKSFEDEKCALAGASILVNSAKENSR